MNHDPMDRRGFLRRAAAADAARIPGATYAIRGPGERGSL